MKQKKRLTLLCVPVVLAVILAVQAFGLQKEKTVVVCVGDSITYGAGVEENRAEDSYPAILQKLLGDSYSVMNCGKSGATLQDEGDRPYRSLPEYQESLEAKGQIYLILLGTNDCRNKNWNAERYREELRAFVEEYQSLGKNTVYLMCPPCVYVVNKETRLLEKRDSFLIDVELYQIIGEIAEELQTGLIDLHTLTEDHPEWYKDTLHPNREGNEAIAKEVFDVIA